MEKWGLKIAKGDMRMQNGAHQKYENKIANGSPGMESCGCKDMNDSRGSVDGKLEMTVRVSGRWVALRCQYQRLRIGFQNKLKSSRTVRL